MVLGCILLAIAQLGGCVRSCDAPKVRLVEDVMALQVQSSNAFVCLGPSGKSTCITVEYALAGPKASMQGLTPAVLLLERNSDFVPGIPSVVSWDALEEYGALLYPMPEDTCKIGSSPSGTLLQLDTAKSPSLIPAKDTIGSIQNCRALWVYVDQKARTACIPMGSKSLALYSKTPKVTLGQSLDIDIDGLEVAPYACAWYALVPQKDGLPTPQWQAVCTRLMQRHKRKEIKGYTVKQQDREGLKGVLESRDIFRSYYVVVRIGGGLVVATLPAQGSPLSSRGGASVIGGGLV